MAARGRLGAANPEGNQLREGAGHDVLLEAITRSGYPLETIIAARLKKRHYSIQEEWPYADSDSGEERTLDLSAGRQLQRLNQSDRGRMGIYLNLLIECKVSELPYVAFQSVEPPNPDEYPSLTGVPHRKVSVFSEQGGGRYREVPVQELLGFGAEPFMVTPPVASSLSRAERKGKDLALSGERPYKALAYPLTKALSFHRRNFAAHEGQRDWWWVHPAIALAVVDAPLTLARTPAEKPQVDCVPWVRLVRHHAPDPSDRWGRAPRVSMLEVVHSDFFDSFLDDYLTPFAEGICEKLKEHQDILIAGKAVVPNSDGGIAQVEPYEET